MIIPDRRKVIVGVVALAGIGVYGGSTIPAASPLQATIAVLDRHAGGSAHAARHGGISAAKLAKVIGFAKKQLGKPYVWGGTGPSSYDCSGLVMEAYAAAGITIPRTSQVQWQQLPHVTSPQPGDLVFFPGVDGTRSAPGHVGLVLGPHLMIQAYASGTPVQISSYGLSSSLQGVQTGDIVGYARPSS